jgi:glycosyltransferase involved in cell wall biosynthesis
VGGVSDLMGKTVGDQDKKCHLTENGILISSGDSEALAEALIYTIENRKEVKDMTDRARDFVLQNYCMERLVKDMGSLYSELLIKS